VDHCLDIAEHAAERIAASPHLELAVEPALTVVLVRRLGWSDADYETWCKGALRSGLAMVTPTKHLGETVLRFCFVNPLTTREDVDLVLADLSRPRRALPTREHGLRRTAAPRQPPPRRPTPTGPAPRVPETVRRREQASRMPAEGEQAMEASA